MNLYASAARGFEAPTLNEMFYSAAGGFNYGLQPSKNRQLELGAKAVFNKNSRVELALFQVRTSGELVVDTSSGGRSSYSNAGETLRQGLELALDSQWRHGISTRLAATQLRAIYDTATGRAARGKRLPGVPSANLYGELAWNSATHDVGVAAEAIASSRVFADDANADQPAPGYAIVNLRAQAQQELGGCPLLSLMYTHLYALAWWE